MNEYEQHINEFLIHSHSSFSNIVSEEEWGDTNAARKYLEKYWLQTEDYIQNWKPIEQQIFQDDKEFPDMIFNDQFNFIAKPGGCLFTKNDFLIFQALLRDLDEKEFVIIQHTNDFEECKPLFKMKYPTSISWEELKSGNYISAIILEMNYNQYKIYGSSPSWGRYSASDYDYPLDIYGFNSTLETIFSQKIKISSVEKHEINDWLPAPYKKHMI